MVSRDELIKFIEEKIGLDLLVKANKIDTNANGVQVIGNGDVSKLALGVSATLDFFEKSTSWGAEFCLTHHGIHLDSRYIYNSRLDLAQQKILKHVFTHNLTVAGYHYALDAQPDFGNNATIIKRLGAKRLDIPYLMEGWGWVAEFDTPQDVHEVVKKCKELIGNEIYTVFAGPKKIKRIGVCSGGGKPFGSMIHEIYQLGIDLHITGEIAHSGIHLAKECGLNYFAGGHYATEVFGVQELGQRLKSHYKNKLEVEFIDVPNPL